MSIRLQGADSVEAHLAASSNAFVCVPCGGIVRANAHCLKTAFVHLHLCRQSESHRGSHFEPHCSMGAPWVHSRLHRPPHSRHANTIADPLGPHPRRVSPRTLRHYTRIQPLTPGWASPTITLSAAFCHRLRTKIQIDQ